MKLSRIYNFRRKLINFYSLRDTGRAYVKDSEAVEYIKYLLVDYPEGINFLTVMNHQRHKDGLTVVNYVTDERRLRFDRIADSDKQSRLNEISRQERYKREHVVTSYIRNEDDHTIRRVDTVIHGREYGSNWDFRISHRTPVIRQE